MVEGVQHFRLEDEVNPLCDWEVLGDGYVVVGGVGTVEPDSLAYRARSRVLRNVGRVSSSATRQILGVDESYICRPWNGILAHRTLKLRASDSIQDNATISVIIECVVTLTTTCSRSQQEGCSRLESKDRSHRPTADDLIYDTAMVGKHLPFAKWQVI